MSTLLMFKKITSIFIISLFFLSASGIAHGATTGEDVITSRNFKFEINGKKNSVCNVVPGPINVDTVVTGLPGPFNFDTIEVTIEEDRPDHKIFTVDRIQFVEDIRNATLAIRDINNQTVRTIDFFECVPVEYNPPSVDTEDDSLLEESFGFKPERVEEA